MNSNLTQPIRLLIHGASGRMGRALLRLGQADPRFLVVAAASQSGAGIEGSSVPVFAAADLARCPAFDVAIDFSLPAGLSNLLDACVQRGSALISGTTGLAEIHRSLLASAAGQIPILWAANFSLGVVVMEELVRRASVVLPSWPVEITETHHIHKKDSPSGTAAILAQAAKRSFGPEPVIRSLREGEVIGEHVLRFAGPGESLELAHKATDRDIFARGALQAAQLLAGNRPGSWRLGELIFGASDGQ